MSAEKKRANVKKYLQTDKGKACTKRYRDKMIKNGTLAKRERDRRANSPQYRIAHRLRIRTLQALKGIDKAVSTVELIGCTVDELKRYLESLFQEGMSWNNTDMWHIDHKRPCCSFDLTDPSQQKECFHYTNVQPLWKAENLKKGSKYLITK